MSLRSMQFAHLEPSDEAAQALATVWFSELGGSAESRMAQLSAQRWLTFFIKRRMEGDPAARTIAQVVRDAESQVAQGGPGSDIGLETLLLNVTEARVPLYRIAWKRTLGSLHLQTAPAQA